MTILDRYILGTWVRLFVVTAIGFPVVAVITEMIQDLTELLDRGLGVGQIAWSYVFGIPAWAALVMPAAVLFATIFTIGGMARHSEVTAAKAGGASFYRLILPIVLAALVAVGLAVLVSELAVRASARQVALQEDPRSQSSSGRYNFVYRGDEGWVYAIRALDVDDGTMQGLVFERAGVGAEYPTLVIRADSARWHDSTGQWTLYGGESRRLPRTDLVGTMAFDSLELPTLRQRPDELMAEAQAPEAMRYAELGRYIESVERAGSATGRLKVQHAQRLSIPAACLVIALFGAPLAMAAPRSGSAFGVGVSLGATIVYVLLARIALALATSEAISPVLLAWLPTLLFLLAALVLLDRVRQ